MHVVHVAPEMSPFAKVGGLGDVVGSLPLAQPRDGHRVSVVLPGYRRILDRVRDQLDEGFPVSYRVDGVEVHGLAQGFDYKGLRILLIRHDIFFDRPELYGDKNGAYLDNGIRYAWFAGAALTALRALTPTPEVVVAHDWPTALLPVLLRAHGYPGDPLEGTASVQVIHNLAHQGVFPLELGRRLHLPETLLRPTRLESLGLLNMLKGGILAATKVVTVSPTYAQEIVWPALGEGLDAPLLARGDDLVGILNGLDIEDWDPRRDEHLPHAYGPSDPAGKAACKAALQKELGLDVDPDQPLFGVVSRVDPQKGIDLVEQLGPWLVENGGQLVLLGSGRAGMLDPLHGLAGIWRRSVSINERFDEGLARRIYAGSDFFLMPSRFEPCGLGQLVALRYGAIPIVRRTGGLADTVHDVGEHPESGNGLVFETPDLGGLRWAAGRALELFREDGKHLAAVRRRGMAEDLSWDRSAREYDRLLAHARIRESRRVLAL